MGEEEVLSTVEFPIFHVQKKKFWRASMEARVTSFKLAIMAGVYAYE
jgi:hypothetical protein